MKRLGSSVRRHLLVFLASVLVLISQSACYWNAEVQSSQMGLRMHDGVKVDEVVGPGRYSDMGGWFSDMVTIDVSAKTVEWNDPSLVTSDKQPIGLTLGITYRRSPEQVQQMWQEYRNEAVNDEFLAAQVLNRVPRVAKAVTTQFTLDEMLGIGGDSNRTEVQNQIIDLLKAELAEVGITVLDVGINDINVAQSYLDALEAKAKAQVDTEVNREKTRQLEEQLRQEQAETKIAVEVAQRENAVNEAKAKAYEESPELLALRKLELLSGIIGQNDKFWFVDPNVDLTLILGQDGQIVPVTDQ